MINKKISLGFYPTPLHLLDNLSKKYKEHNIYIKRDDLSGLATGGNKVRKLEYLLQQAIEQGYTQVLTDGAHQSNHCRQTAAACAKLGLKCHLMLSGHEPERYGGNLLLSYLSGANIHFTGKGKKEGNVEEYKKVVEKNGDKCFVIPLGGSTIIGALGFVNAVKELKEQLKNQDLKIDYIFFGSSSGSTQAGLMLGFELYNYQTQLMPINIDKTDFQGITLEEKILTLLNEGTELLNIQKKYKLEDIPLIRDYSKPGYAIITEIEKKAITTLAENEGIFLDPNYSARAFGGMLDYIEKKKLQPNSNILFWHTGGIPELFESGDKLRKAIDNNSYN